MVLQKIKRRTKRFKMSKAQRNKISAAARKFKFPILTGIAVGPAVLLSLQEARAAAGIENQLSAFARAMLRFYTGIQMNATGQAIFRPANMMIGWGPLLAVGAVKIFAKGRVMAINRALSRAQIPANLG